MKNKNMFDAAIAEPLGDFLQDNLEIVLDRIIKDDTIKEIPVIGNIVSLFKIGKSISDRIFLRNLMNFLFEIKDIPVEKRIKKIAEIDKDEKLKLKTGNFLISILARLESEEKAKFIGYLFKKYIQEEINRKEFLKLTYIVDKILWSELVEFSQLEKLDRSVDTILVDSLISHGLMTTIITQTALDFERGPTIAELNELGVLLKKQLIVYERANDH
jgi:hypothetical protein